MPSSNDTSGMARWAFPFRRKLKTIILCMLAIGLTAMIAINTKSETFVTSVNRNLVGRSEEYDSPVESKHACYQQAAETSLANYYTSDIYSSINGGKVSLKQIKVPSPSTQRLEVFVVPFSHVDPGWLRTFDSYSQDTNQILSNMNEFLSKNPRMRFIWAELIFFERWYTAQNDTVKKSVRKLIETNRFELASGSWVMTDEASAYFPVSVDNIIEGNQFMKKNFETLPTSMWSNDPFGYSNSVPYLFAKAGIKRAIINRIHHGIKQHLQRQRAIPFKWRQYHDIKGVNDVFTQVLPYTHYDILNSCGSDSSVCCQFDFKRIVKWHCGNPQAANITNENIKSKADQLVKSLRGMAQMYESNVVLMMHGDDFRFDTMEEWHLQHDNFVKLFDQINKGNEVKIQFGTFKDYFTAQDKWYKAKKKEPPTLSGDFFPYLCAANSYWTGYFTTRPFYKRQGRILHNAIRTADLLLTRQWKDLPSEASKRHSGVLTKARRALMLFQHHDAITGTSKQSVMKDYSLQLFQALKATNTVIEELISTELKFDLIEEPLAYNETSSKTLINVASGRPITLAVYNSLPYQRQDIITVTVKNTNIVVQDSEGNVLPAQIEPHVHRGSISKDRYLLAFRTVLNPLQTSFYTLSTSADVQHKRNVDLDAPYTVMAEIIAPDHKYGITANILPKEFKSSPVRLSDFGINTTRVRTAHSENGEVQKIRTPAITSLATLSQKFVAYTGARGGAYIMIVSEIDQKYSPPVSHTFVVKGPVRQTVYTLGQNVVQSSLTVNDLEGVAGEQLHFDIRLDISMERNMELATRFETSLNSVNSSMYTDSVGMQLLKREKVDGAVQSNYYPMPTATVIADQDLRYTITSNVAHGAMQYKNNGVEIMLDRALNQDDGKGLGGETDGLPLDLKPVDMKFIVLLERVTEKLKSKYHAYNSLGGNRAVQEVLYPPMVFAAETEERQPSVYRDIPLTLPCEYQLLTVRKLTETNEHMMIIFRHGADCGLSGTVNCVTHGLKTPIVEYLQALNVETVEVRNLAGTVKEKGPMKIKELNLDVAPMEFIVLVFTIKSS